MGKITQDAFVSRLAPPTDAAVCMKCGAQKGEICTRPTGVKCPFDLVGGVECRPSCGHAPTESEARKGIPIATGVLDYFPDALADIARLSKAGNDKHNPGEPLHWSREKSGDHADCILRHMLDRGTVDTDGLLHDTKVAWRALANLQLTIERLRAEGKY